MIDTKTEELLKKRGQDIELHGKNRSSNFISSTLAFFTGTSVFIGAAVLALGTAAAVGVSIVAAPVVMAAATTVGVAAGVALTYASYIENKRVREAQISEMKKNEQKITEHLSKAEQHQQAIQLPALSIELNAMTETQRAQLQDNLESDNVLADHLDDLISAPAAKGNGNTQAPSLLDTVIEKQKQQVEQERVNVEKKNGSTATDKRLKKIGQLKVATWFAQNGKTILTAGSTLLFAGLAMTGITLGAPAIIASAVAVAVGATFIGAVGFSAQRILDRANKRRTKHIGALKENLEDAKVTATACKELKGKVNETLSAAKIVRLESQLQATGDARVQTQSAVCPQPAAEVVRLQSPTREIAAHLPGVGANHPNDPVRRIAHSAENDAQLEQTFEPEIYRHQGITVST